MSYGAIHHRPSLAARRGPEAPELHVLRSPAQGQERDLVDRILDLQEAIQEQHLALATGLPVPLLEQLELEREKVAVLRAVRDRGNDVDVVLGALAAAEHRVQVLERELRT